MKALYKIQFTESTITDSSGSERDVFQQHVTVGRSSSCTIQYDQSWQSVSREHLIIETENDSVKIKKPQGLNNEILVNGKLLNAEEALVRKKAKVQLGMSGPAFSIRPASKKSSKRISFPDIAISNTSVSLIQLIISYIVLGISIIAFIWSMLSIW